MQASVSGLLQRRRDRGIYAIMLAAENAGIKKSDPEFFARLRRVVMAEFNGLRDLAVDVIKSMDEGEKVVLNEYWLERLDEIHAAVVGNGSG